MVVELGAFLTEIFSLANATTVIYKTKRRPQLLTVMLRPGAERFARGGE